MGDCLAAQHPQMSMVATRNASVRFGDKRSQIRTVHLLTCVSPRHAGPEPRSTAGHRTVTSGMIDGGLDNQDIGRRDLKQPVLNGQDSPFHSSLNLMASTSFRFDAPRLIMQVGRPCFLEKPGKIYRRDYFIFPTRQERDSIRTGFPVSGSPTQHALRSGRQ